MPKHARVTVVIEKVASLTVHPKQALFGPMLPDEFEELRADIDRRGLKYPVERDTQHRVICGSQRLAAVRQLGWDTVDVIIRSELLTEDDIVEHMILDNLRRRHLLPSQKYRAAVELTRIEEARAAERSALSGKGIGAAPEADSETGTDAPAPSRGRTRDVVAKQLAGKLEMSGRSYDDLRTVMESENDEVKDEVDRGKLGLRAAAEKVRKKGQGIRTRKIDTDDPRWPALQLAKFKKQVESFCEVLDSYPQDAGVFAPDVERLMGQLCQRIKGRGCCPGYPRNSEE